ncbi:ankyrin repeat domain-containing protein SOWAHA-like [Pangasianodon hypophthalmus]|uniref:ankyrin repeat domain-containing protein SOWAHA-like n=1 Tax=Pangasianodon hypophthalmus TaxID=310915 RepID=UPI002306F7B8|nr:ankyrin repeat domain-containing protein SOWAHA-like [Pangasianodon hypophthalmus]
MDISQERIVSVLVEEGGKIKNSDLLNKFKGPLNCSDPAEKKQNRDLFKMIINNLAVVKEIEEVKYIVLRKKFQHLVQLRSGDGGEEQEVGGGAELEHEELKPAAEHKQHREVCEHEHADEAPPDENRSQQKTPSDSEAESSDSTPAPSFIELALQRQKSTDVKVKKSLHFVMPLKSGTDDAQKHRPACANNPETSSHKPFFLPLRMPPVVITPVAQEETNKMKIPPEDNNPVKVHLAPVNSVPGPPCSPRYKRRSSVDSVGIGSSPQSRRHCKSAKPADEPKYSDTVPLESSEHEWMVVSASGRWSLVYGLLLNDAQLAEKKDFISGFTALHWAAKCGNCDMLCKIIDLSRKTGKGVDVNTKSYAGYTPLHVAAIHGQEYAIGILVNEYGANYNLRDNSGKKPHHYLDKGASHSIRELLGGLKVVPAEPQKNPEDTDAHKHTHTISRLFQPQTIGYKKKPKSRSSFLSMVEDAKDEKSEHSNPVHRVFSDVFS